MLKIIYSAVDTLECSFKGTLKHEKAKELEAKKTIARDEMGRSIYDKAAERAEDDHRATMQKASAALALEKYERGYSKKVPKKVALEPPVQQTNEIELAGERFLVKAHGSGIYSYIVYNARFNIRITPSLKIPYFVYATIRSITLHELGCEKSVEALYEIVKELSQNENITSKISRLDVCTDFQGWAPRYKDIDKFVCKANLDGARRNCGKLGTFEFGKGNMMARLYNKTEEIKVSKKEWFMPIWQQSEAYDQALPVWRLEYQLRRPTLKELGIDSVEDSLSRLKGIWQYGMGWLELKKPSKNQQRTRWPLDKKWVQLRDETAFEGKTCSRVRRYKRQKNAERIVRGFGGYLTSLAAMYGDFSEAKAFTRARILYRHYLTNRGLDFEHMVKVKIEEQEEDLPF
ncbi:MAG: hypothetical protein Q8K68_04910 [Nitrospirota bacterium]|nr:hypothetical protein [Nitrospirota bacterium]